MINQNKLIAAARRVGTLAKELTAHSCVTVRSIGFGAALFCIPICFAQPPTAPSSEWGAVESGVQIPPYSAISSLLFSNDGKTIATVHTEGKKDGALQLWECGTGNLLWTANPPAKSVLAFSPDDKTLAGITPSYGLVLWDAQAGRVKQTATRHMHVVFTAAFTPNAKIVASGGTGESDSGDYSLSISGHPGEVNLWDAETGRLLHTLKGHTNPVVDIAFSPDGRLIASASLDRTVKVWEVPTGRLQRTLTVGESGWGASSVAFSPDGKTLATGSGGSRDEKSTGQIKLWLVESGELRLTMTDPGTAVLITESPALMFSPDGKTLASAGTNQQIILWNVETGRSHLSLERRPQEQLGKSTVAMQFVAEGLRIANKIKSDRIEIGLWRKK